jgi:sucrose-6F-phosphate phosphohydrolase
MMKRLLLCTDLDRTLIANGTAPESPLAMQHLRKFIARPEVQLVYVSGRDATLIENAIAEFALPQPDYLVADVGSSIYVQADSHWQRRDDWHKLLAADWQQQDCQALLPLLAHYHALRLQPDNRQGRFKLSFFLAVQEQPAKLLAAIQRTLTQAGFASRLIWSLDPYAKTGLLDILPARASKLHAIEYLLQTEELSVDEMLFCGDSGNDMDVLTSCLPAVLVANADRETRKRALRDAAHAQTSDKLYLARGDFFGMNGNYAAGILEGIAHYFPQTTPWMELA